MSRAGSVQRGGGAGDRPSHGAESNAFRERHRRRLRKYRLGSDDVLLIRVADAPEIGAQPVRIDPAGDIRLPMVGIVRAAGRTVEDLEAELMMRLKFFIQKPDLSISVTEFHSQPVSIVGAVQRSGVQDLQGPQDVDRGSVAGGRAGPDAGPTVRITRGREFGGDSSA